MGIMDTLTIFWDDHRLYMILGVVGVIIVAIFLILNTTEPSLLGGIGNAYASSTKTIVVYEALIATGILVIGAVGY